MSESNSTSCIRCRMSRLIVYTLIWVLLLQKQGFFGITKIHKCIPSITSLAAIKISCIHFQKIQNFKTHNTHSNSSDSDSRPWCELNLLNICGGSGSSWIIKFENYGNRRSLLFAAFCVTAIAAAYHFQ
jgi:hypothetical protein